MVDFVALSGGLDFKLTCSKKKMWLRLNLRGVGSSRSCHVYVLIIGCGSCGIVTFQRPFWKEFSQLQFTAATVQENLLGPVRKI